MANKKYCSPLADSSGKTCLPIPLLKEIDTLVNAKAQSAKAQSVKILNKLKKHYNKKCKSNNTDSCWIEQPEIKGSPLYPVLKKYFRPLKPTSWNTNPRKWLNNFDIAAVLKQYEEKYTDFKFLGVFPIDFHSNKVCSIYNMCQIDVADLIKQKITRFGLVLNLDAHGQPGSHWVSMFCNLDPNSIQYGLAYFDSGGTYSLPKDVQLFGRDIKTQVDDKKFKLYKNKVTKQFQNTECGIFSIMFIHLCILNKNAFYTKIVEMIPHDRNDDGIYRLRNEFYRP